MDSNPGYDRAIPPTLGDVGRLRDFLAAKSLIQGLKSELDRWRDQVKAS